MTNEAIKRHAISIGITFVSSFFLVVGFELSNPEFAFNTDAIKVVVMSGFIAGSRAVFKFIFELASQEKS